MFIEEICIEGFKSYAQRTVVPNFDPCFNAITGLNGTGKSNILDSICFVLGITNLSQARRGPGGWGGRRAAGTADEGRALARSAREELQPPLSHVSRRPPLPVPRPPRSAPAHSRSLCTSRARRA